MKLRKCPKCGHRWAPSKTRGRPRKPPITADGRTLSLDTWADLLGVSVTAVNYHLRKGKSFEEVVRHFLEEPPPRKMRIISMGKRSFLAA